MKKKLLFLLLILVMLFGATSYAAQITINENNVAVNEPTEKSTLLTAFYNKDGALTKVQKYNCDTSAEFPYIREAEETEMKAFLWDMGTLRPICESKSKKFTENSEHSKILVAYFSQIDNMPVGADAAT